MAEGLMKKFYGHETYVQSAGVLADMDVDGFAIAVCAELGIELARHKTRSFDEMQKLGDELSSFDRIVALSPASQREAKEITRFYALQVEYWPIMDPTATGETRDQKLAAYRQARALVRQDISGLYPTITGTASAQQTGTGNQRGGGI